MTKIKTNKTNTGNDFGSSCNLSTSGSLAYINVFVSEEDKKNRDRGREE